MLESTRAKEQAVKKETTEQLEIFRRQQEEADKELLDGAGNADDTAGSPADGNGDTQWAVGARKRKRLKEDKGSKGPKLRKSSSTGEPPQLQQDKNTAAYAKDAGEKKMVSRSDNTPTAPNGATKPAGTPDNPDKDASKTQKDVGGEPVAAAKLSGLTGLGLADYSSDDD